MAFGLVAVCGDRRVSMKFYWFHMMSISTLCSSCSFERSGCTWTKFQTQCSLWKRKNKPVSYKLSEAARLNSLFCLCLVLRLYKSMAKPQRCCRLTQAEISGIEDSRCVWRPPSLHEILLIPYDVHLHFVLFTRFFWKIWPYLNPIPNSVQPLCSLWKRKNKPVSCKLSEAARLNSLFCLCLVLRLSKSMAKPQRCCRLTQAEINGLRASRCVWRPPSLHEILLIPYDVHLHFALFVFFWKICSRSCSSKHEATQCKTSIYNSDLQTSKWSAIYARCSKEKRCYGDKFEFFHGNFVRLCALFLWELCQFETGEFRQRLHAQSAQSRFLLRDAWNLRLVRLRTWPASASNMQKTKGGWRHRIASIKRAIKKQPSERLRQETLHEWTGIIFWHVVLHFLSDGRGSSIPKHPRHARHPGGVTQSSGSEIPESCETVAPQEPTLQMSSWSIATWYATCGFF